VAVAGKVGAVAALSAQVELLAYLLEGVLPVVGCEFGGGVEPPAYFPYPVLAHQGEGFGPLPGLQVRLAGSGGGDAAHEPFGAYGPYLGCGVRVLPDALLDIARLPDVEAPAGEFQDVHPLVVESLRAENKLPVPLRAHYVEARTARLSTNNSRRLVLLLVVVPHAYLGVAVGVI